ncbi:MAG TPA: MFS transporter, partial [Acidimicrobiales bacterium]|nr:MFS transporter [Acidimicrobiales bacterium]
MRRGPLAESYGGAVALVVFSLTPYLVLTAGVFPLADLIGKSLAMSPGRLDITIAMSTGAYAVGTVLAVQFAVHLPARRMLVVYEVAFVTASIVAASATSADAFMGAFIAQGLCTSLMLIAAVPPLVTSWPARKMPITGAVMNLCIFGAVAVGPTLGALQLSGGAWRPVFWAVAGVAFLALLFSLLTYEDDPALDR